MTRALILLFLMLAVTACSQPALEKYDPLSGRPMATPQELYQDGLPQIDRKIAEATSRYVDTTSEPVMNRPKVNEGGTLRRLNVDPPPAVFRPSQTGPALVLPALAKSGAPQPVEVSFDRVSLRAVIEFMMQEYMKIPYAIQEPFQDAPVNWRVSGTYTDADLLTLFETFLGLQGITVARQRELVTFSQLVNTTPYSSAGFPTQLWRLKNVTAKSLEPLLVQAVSPQGELTLLPDINTLVVKDSPAQLEAFDTLINRLDISPLQGKQIMVYTPQYIKPSALAAMLKDLPAQTSADAQLKSSGLDAAVIEGTARVVIVTSDERSQQLLRTYLAQVDRPGELPLQVFHYKLKHLKAEDMVKTVTRLLASLNFPAEEVALLPHEAGNSVLITATADQYYEIRRLLESLDADIPSALIDAAIVEVNLEDSLAYGVEWFLSGSGFGAAADATIDLANSANISTPAASIGVISLTSNRFATLDLLARATQLQVLSRPRVLVKNNATAEIKSTDQIRVLKSIVTTSAQSGGTNLPRSEFEEKEVGVTLEVIPRISDDGQVNMTVVVEDSRQGADDIVTIDGQTSRLPTFNIRRVTTEFSIKDGQTVMIAGLIKKTQNRDRTRVPFFSDLPLVGAAFSNRLDEEKRTELVIFITPYVVRSATVASMISEAFSGIDLDETVPAKSSSLFH